MHQIHSPQIKTVRPEVCSNSRWLQLVRSGSHLGHWGPAVCCRGKTQRRQTLLLPKMRLWGVDQPSEALREEESGISPHRLHKVTDIMEKVVKCKNHMKASRKDTRIGAVFSACTFMHITAESSFHSSDKCIRQIICKSLAKEKWSHYAVCNTRGLWGEQWDCGLVKVSWAQLSLYKWMPFS